MARAAPGEDARVAVRRNIPDDLVVLENHSGKHHIRCPHRTGKEIYLCLQVRKHLIIGNFTQKLSGIGVGRGRLGEVVSLAGDCRPPPPGNPLRPPDLYRKGGWSRDGVEIFEERYHGIANYDHLTRTVGGFLSSVWLCFSFNNNKKRSNLKNLNSSEYFKENRSYFSCTENIPVLEFVCFPLPHVRAERSGTPIYSHNKCSRNVGV